MEFVVATAFNDPGHYCTLARDADDCGCAAMAEAGRSELAFHAFDSARDAFDIDGYRRLRDAGVTHVLTLPWIFTAGADATLQHKRDGLRRFAARWPGGCARARRAHVGRDVGPSQGLGEPPLVSGIALGRGAERDDYVTLTDWTSVLYLDREVKIRFPARSLGGIAARTWSRNDEPIDDDRRVLEARASALGRMLRELARFRKGGRG